MILEVAVTIAAAATIQEAVQILEVADAIHFNLSRIVANELQSDRQIGEEYSLPV
jgi:hypothetical protein